ncbi:hypothetical protein [Nocardioides antri]|nr:hypothetical protein [Nocardioides antri]
MGSTSYLVWFVATAVMTNVVIYGGIALAYFTYKRRAEKARELVRDAA